MGPIWHGLDSSMNFANYLSWKKLWMHRKLFLIIHVFLLIQVSVNWAIIGSGNGLSPIQHQAIIWISTELWLIGSSETTFSEILIKIQQFSFKKVYLKMLSAKWHPLCLDRNMLTLHMQITYISNYSEYFFTDHGIYSKWSLKDYDLRIDPSSFKHIYGSVRVMELRLSRYLGLLSTVSKTR